MPNSDKRCNMGSDLIKLYDVTKNQVDFNFLTIQVQVPSQLNPDLWQYLLLGLLGPTITIFDQVRLPSRFNRNSKLGKNKKSHVSSHLFSRI